MVTWNINPYDSFTVNPPQYTWDPTIHHWKAVSVPADENKMYFNTASGLGSVDLYSRIDRYTGVQNGNPAWDLYSHKITGFSLAFKVLITNYTSNDRTILFESAPRRGDETGFGMLFGVASDGYIYGYVGRDDGSPAPVEYIVKSDSQIALNTETAIIYTVQDGDFKLYVNGIQQTQTDTMLIETTPSFPLPTPPPPYDTGTDVYLRTRLGFTTFTMTGDGTWLGYMRPPTIYNRILTGTEIANFTVADDLFPSSPAARIDFSWIDTPAPENNWYGEVHDYVNTAITSPMSAVNSIANGIFRDDTVLDGISPTTPIYSYWKFNETSGYTAHDSSCDFRHGALNGNAAFSAGKLNNALNLYTVPQVDFGNTFDFDRTDPFSVSFWVRTDTHVGDTQIIGRNTNGDDKQATIFIHYNGGIPAVLLYFRLVNTWSTNHLETYWWPAWSYMAFDHVVISYDGSGTAAGVNMYFNGVLQSKTINRDNLTGSCLSTANAKMMESGGSNTSKVDELQIYNRALSLGDATTLYNGGTGTETPLSTPYAVYHMNESEGPIVDDSSGNSRIGIAGSPTWVTGKLYNALNFDGLAQYVNCGNVADFERTDPFSVEFWFKIDALSSGQRTILNKQMSTSPFTGWQVYIDSSNKMCFSLSNTAVTDEILVRTNAAISTGVWHHAVITNEGSSYASGVAIYIDGVFVFITKVYDTLTSDIANSGGLKMGVGADLTSSFFYGIIDNVLIYTNVMAPADVDVRYNSGTGREERINWSNIIYGLTESYYSKIQGITKCAVYKVYDQA